MRIELDRVAGSTRPVHWRRLRWVFRLAVLCTVLCGVFVLRRPLFWGNCGVVDPGRVYRCAQPTGNLEEVLKTYRPASILNLRGGSDDDDWYVAEVRATRELGIDFYDLPLSPVRRPTRKELMLLLDVLKRCRYPLLIHCKSGSDRTGLAAGLYLMSQRGLPPAQALGAFSLEYGHLPMGGPERLHAPFLEYDAWLKAGGLTHTPARLAGWIRMEYHAADPPRPVISMAPGPRPHSPSGSRATVTR